jgi:acetyltransferase-like isoleucine patch superfamily enzyme
MGKKINTIKNIMKVSFLKTILFNIHYFGVRAVFKPRVILSKNVKLLQLKGKVFYNRELIRGIHIGFAVNPQYSGKKTKTTFSNEGTIVFDGKSVVSSGCSIFVGHEATLKFGNNVHLSQNVSIECHKNIFIGDETMIGFDTFLLDSDNHQIFNESGLRINDDRNITIGKHVWICAKCMILKGGIIGDGCVVGAGTTITKNYSQTTNSIIVNGKIKNGIIWKP